MTSGGEDGLKQIVMFALDEPRYALPLSTVNRVVRVVEIMPLPKAPEIVLGVVNVQGHIVPVMDVRKRFHLQKRALDTDDRLIIAQTSTRTVALLVDSVVGVHTLAENEFAGSEQALPFAEYLHGVAKTEEGIVLIYDLEQFLSLDEERTLDAALSEDWGVISVLSDTLLSQFGELVATRTALHFPESRWRDLERKACSAAKAFAFDDVGAFVQWVVSSPLTSDQMDALVSCLTVNETYFWREPNSFQVLETKILPELIRAREGNGRRLRIWSAGCSTGEEAYSIAIALHKVLRDSDGWNITILATDINPKMLQKASAGIYGNWSFRNAPAWLTEKYFRLTQDGMREIIPEIRRMVDFAYLNLAEDPYPSSLNNTNAMDVIFCRNVLMYFSPDYVRHVGERLYDALVDEGWLIVGASELSQHSFPKFISVTCEGTIGYQKKVGFTQTDRKFSFEADNKKPFPASDLFATMPIVESPVPPVTISAGDFFLSAKPPGEVDNATAPISGFNQGDHVDEIKIDHIAAAADHSCEEQEVVEDDAASSFDAIPEKESSAVVSDLHVLANEGRLEEALVLCDDAIAADKMNTGLHYLRAVMLQELDREDEAIASLNRALYLNSEFILAYFALGNLGIRKGNMRMAKRCFKNVLSLLNAYREEDILPESEGLTAGRFKEIIQATMQIGTLV